MGRRCDMTQATTQDSITSQTIAVEHIRISSGRSFVEVRRKLEGTVPKDDCPRMQRHRSDTGYRLSPTKVLSRDWPRSVPSLWLSRSALLMSLSGGHPFMSDGPKDVRALGLSFLPLHGEEWRRAMINIPVFAASYPHSWPEQAQRGTCSRV
jgi:hypothetical protein